MTHSKYILTLSCSDHIGIVATVTTLLSHHKAFILELSQYSDSSTQHFFMRVLFEIPITQIDTFKTAFLPITQQFTMTWSITPQEHKQNVLILTSQHSHCLNDLLHRWSTNALPMNIIGVLSNHQISESLCKWHNIPFYFIPVQNGNTQNLEKQITAFIDQHNIDLIILARYMQIVSSSLCKKMHGKIINIHHSFLPGFKGAKPYHQAFNRGVKIIGATAHYVTSELDEGPIIDQDIRRVPHSYLPKQLIQTGQDIESQVLTRSVRWHLERKIFLNEHKTIIFD